VHKREKRMDRPMKQTAQRDRGRGYTHAPREQTKQRS
jgi:hypothetical protein